jgi:cell division transport system permease protein
MAVAAAVTVATVVRLGLRTRREELEIMELVGAPLAFIRGPFVAEGFLQGGIGALVAIAALWVGFLVAMAWWGTDLNSLVGGGSVQFLPIRLCLYLIFGGMLVGSIGGLVAAREAA